MSDDGSPRTTPTPTPSSDQRRRREDVRLLLGAAVLFVLGLALRAVSRAQQRARGVPVSPVDAGWRVGRSFLHREGLAAEGEPEPAGLTDPDDLASEGFDPDRVDPEVRRFYERTADYEMDLRATWHLPFRAGAALAGQLTGVVGQLDLPGPKDGSWHRLDGRFVAVDEPTTPPDLPDREGVRGWVRTDAGSGEPVFVALYGTHAVDGDRVVNIAAPLPGGNISTVLWPTNLDWRADLDVDDDWGEGGGRGGVRYGDGDGEAEAGGKPDHAGGIAMTTLPERVPEGAAGGHPGLYLRTPGGVVRLPMHQEFRVWPAGDVGGDVDEEGGAVEPYDLGAVHEMWLFGRRFLTVDYRIRRKEGTDREG